MDALSNMMLENGSRMLNELSTVLIPMHFGIWYTTTKPPNVALMAIAERTVPLQPGNIL
jgi:hypothetical protein